MISYILAILTGVIVLGVDQYTKYFIVSNFELYETAGFLKGLIRICFTYNDGAAYGILPNKTWLLLSITAVLMIVCFSLLVKLGRQNKVVFWSVMLIMSGGLGNMIDRIFRHGLVVDFLQFDFYREFPIFNVADCAIVVGGFLLMAYFVYDSVIDAKKKKHKAITENNMENE